MSRRTTDCSPKKTPKTFAAYFAALPAEQREALERIRKVVHELAPEVDETFAYGLPIFKLGGKTVFVLNDRSLYGKGITDEIGRAHV